MTLYEQTPQDAESPATLSRIDVRGVADDTIVITLSGEHDLFTKLRLQEALADAREEPNVIIDLTPCTFIDSTIIGALAAACHRDGRRAGASHW
jgi:anti-anti-sigma factor